MRARFDALKRVLEVGVERKHILVLDKGLGRVRDHNVPIVEVGVQFELAGSNLCSTSVSRRRCA